MNSLDLRWLMVKDKWPLRVKNGSGAVIPPYSVVLISSTTNTNNEIVKTVVQPNAASTDFNWDEYLVTGPFAIGADNTNEGLATNLVVPNYVRYHNNNTPAIKEIWGPKHGQLTLEKWYYGFLIEGGNTTDIAGNEITIARWVGTQEVLVKNGTGSDIAAGHTGDLYDVYVGPEGSEVTTNMQITACNRSSQSFKNGKFGAAARLGGGTYAVPFET